MKRLWTKEDEQLYQDCELLLKLFKLHKDKYIKYDASRYGTKVGRDYLKLDGLVFSIEENYWSRSDKDMWWQFIFDDGTYLQLNSYSSIMPQFEDEELLAYFKYAVQLIKKFHQDSLKIDNLVCEYNRYLIEQEVAECGTICLEKKSGENKDCLIFDAVLFKSDQRFVVSSRGGINNYQNVFKDFHKSYLTIREKRKLKINNSDLDCFIKRFDLFFESLVAGQVVEIVVDNKEINQVVLKEKKKRKVLFNKLIQ
jgi:hypothetical protein